MHYTLCDLLSDLTQNAIEAGSTKIRVGLRESDGEFAAVIADDGRGMSPEVLKRATDPFWSDGVKHPGRKVGLGIPFLIQTAESTGGDWKIESSDGSDGSPRGTTVSCRFDLANIDTPPVGDVAGYLRQALTFDGSYEMTVTRETPRGSFEVRRSELLDALGLAEEGSFTDAASLSLLGQYLESLLEE